MKKMREESKKLTKQYNNDLEKYYEQIINKENEVVELKIEYNNKINDITNENELTIKS
jgi:hypothetical protein